MIGTKQTGAWRTAIKSRPSVFGESLTTPLFTADMKQLVLPHLPRACEEKRHDRASDVRVLPHPAQVLGGVLII